MFIMVHRQLYVVYL